MKKTNAQNLPHSPVHQCAQELKDVLAAMRNAESAVEFELQTCELERIILQLEWWEWQQEGA